MEPQNLQPTPIKQKIIHTALFKDRLIVSLTSIGFIMMVVNVIRVMLSISRYDIDIPIRYTQFGGVDSYVTGNWYAHYSFVIFALLVFASNTLIALRIYRHRRWISVGILAMQIFVMVFLYVIAGAIMETLPVAG